MTGMYRSVIPCFRTTQLLIRPMHIRSPTHQANNNIQTLAIFIDASVLQACTNCKTGARSNKGVSVSSSSSSSVSSYHPMVYRAKDLGKKGRHYTKLCHAAVELLQRCAKFGGRGAKLPHYDHQLSYSRRKPGHVYHCRFHPPPYIFDFCKKDRPADGATCFVGVGNDPDEQMAKNLAALECMFRLDAHNGRRLEGALIAYEKELRKQMEKFPIEQELPLVSWDNWPLDLSLARIFPATRTDRFEFGPLLMDNDERAFHTAKAITLASAASLPEVLYKKNKDTHRLTHCNIKTNNSRHGVYSIRGLGTAHLQFQIDTIPEIRRQRVLEEALEKVRAKMELHGEGQHLLKAASVSPSFGQAKLFVQLPRHHFAHLSNVLHYMKNNPLPIPEPKTKQKRSPPRGNHMDDKKEATTTVSNDDSAKDDDEAQQQQLLQLQERIQALREHQQSNPLPIDDVECHIPYDSDVTIVKGGTGSGKTTRYPLFLSLFANDADDHTKVVVAQPRRLACVTAAERVAYEQGYYSDGDDETTAATASSSGGGGVKRDNRCPIGYAIRFDAHLAPHDASRTVDFCTPGVLLRRAVSDPLFANVSHLVIDEIHERNADIDLLCSLAKQAVKTRQNHPTLPPLRLVLMSATVDSSTWESYFKAENFSVATVQVPDVRRFPIDIVHLGEADFPRGGEEMRSLSVLAETKREELDDIDDSLCKGAAELVLHLFRTDEDLQKGASVLCFLPGMDEIKAVDRYLRKFDGGKRRGFAVRYLHSSVSAQDQRLAFESGRPKVVLATNIAETSLTISDVKYVIDGGRERQHSLLDSTSSSETTTVVGSQLTTVNISQAAAKQRAGRAGRVSAGTCYRLYRKNDIEEKFLPYTLPEMLRMDLSQLALHALSFTLNEGVGHPLELLLGAPDPPTETNLKQTLLGLKHQGLVEFEPSDEDSVGLTGLGRAVSQIPATPRIGRLLFMGLVLRAIEPALQIAALLSVPKLFGVDSMDYSLSPNSKHCSDVVQLLEEYQNYLDLDAVGRRRHAERKLFEQVGRVKLQLEQHMAQFIRRKADAGTVAEVTDNQRWNANSHRLAALVGLVCSATPHIAHLVRNDNSFTTRDVSEKARMHPSSVNHPDSHRVPWYCYNELRATTKPYIHATTAVSPLDLALFSDASFEKLPDGALAGEEPLEISDDEWLFIVDQWVPVAVTEPHQRKAFLLLRKMLTKIMPEQIAVDPASALASEEYAKIVLFAISALEQQRMGNDKHYGAKRNAADQ